MKKFTAFHIWFIFSFITLSVTGILFIRLPLRGDERHIVETIRLFANNFNFNTIADYPEITPPFFYIFYALWAKAFSSSIESLRLLTLIISLITWQLIFYLFQLFVRKDIHVLLLSLLIIINPYFIGTSLFVFTDMFTIMLLLAAVITFLKDKLYLFLIFSTFSILSRQYAVIIPIAIIIFSLLNFKNDKTNNRAYIIVSLISFIPLLFLFIVWKNISPISGIEKWIVPNSSFYNLDYINTYLTFSVIYILPLALIFFIKKRPDNKSLLFALVAAILLSFFTITPSEAVLQQTDIKTVGFAHKSFLNLFGNGNSGVKIILWIFLLAGCYLNIQLIKEFYWKLKSKSFSKEVIFTILWILFLLIMPLSFQVWEKYLTMILPFYALSIYLLIYNPKQKINTKL